MHTNGKFTTQSDEKNFNIFHQNLSTFLGLENTFIRLQELKKILSTLEKDSTNNSSTQGQSCRASPLLVERIEIQNTSNFIKIKKLILIDKLKFKS